MNSFRKILHYLKPYTALIIFSMILMAVEVSANVLQPMYMEQIVDDGVLQMDLQVVLYAGVMMLTVALIGGVGGFFSCVLSNIYSQRFGNDLRKTLYQKMMALSKEQDDVITPGSLITRMTGDTKTITEFSSVVIQMVIKPLLLFIFGIVMVVLIDPLYGLILLISLPIQVLLMIFFIKKSSAIFRIIQKMVDQLNASALHIVTNNRLIKSYVRESYETGRFDRQNLDLTQTVMKVQLFMAILNPLVMLILNAVVVAVIFVGGLQVQAGAIRIGAIMAAISYSQQILMSMMTMGGIFQYISRSKVSADRIAEVLETEPSITSGEKALEGEIEEIAFCDLTFRYPSSKDSLTPALDRISLSIKKGECVGILGSTGAGKSTLAELMIRAYDADDGAVLVNGEDIRNYQLSDLRDRILLVYQDGDILPGTLKDNITAGCRGYQKEDFEKAVRVSRADHIAENLALGYDTPVAERGVTLSGGQKQRVALARALLRNPSVLILDDSFSSLDLITEHEVEEGIRREYRETTLIIISQRISNVMDADRIILLDHGRIIGSGTHEELQNEVEPYRDLLRAYDPEGGDADE